MKISGDYKIDTLGFCDQIGSGNKTSDFSQSHLQLKAFTEPFPKVAQDNSIMWK